MTIESVWGIMAKVTSVMKGGIFMKILKKKTKRNIFLLILAVILMVGVMGYFLWRPYPADETAIAYYAPSGSISTISLDNGNLAYAPRNAQTGLIFYPGAMVEYTAYEPLMKACASRGILCILVKMPAHLSILNPDAAKGLKEQFPYVENWYIGGHSLGGNTAASYVAKNTDQYKGLVLLGSYSSVNLTESGLKVLSIYGSEDKVLNMDTYTKSKEIMPKDFTEIVIDGGNHAGFGMYGNHRGDGRATIENDEQIDLAAHHIAENLE